jgi:hypothetical protein
MKLLFDENLSRKLTLQFYALFWLYGTGCQPIKISAHAIVIHDEDPNFRVWLINS